MDPMWAQLGRCTTNIQELQVVVQGCVAETESMEVVETQILKEKEQVEDLSHLILTSDPLQFLVAVTTLVQ